MNHIFTVMLWISLCLSLCAANASAAPVSKRLYVRTTGNDANDGLSEGAPKASISAAISIASTNDTVDIGTGSYYENVAVDRVIVMHGVDGTSVYGGITIDDVIATSSHPTWISKITVYGSDTVDGVTITGNTSYVWLTRMNIHDSRNGVSISEGDVSDVTFDTLTISGSYHHGIYIGNNIDAEYISVTNAMMSANSYTALYYQGDAGASLADLTITGSTFINNGAGAYNSADTLLYGTITLTGFTGDLTISNTTIGPDAPYQGTPGYFGLGIHGPTTLAPCGSITLSNVSVEGLFNRPLNIADDPGGPGYCMYVANYNHMSNFHTENVTLTAYGNSRALGVCAIEGMWGIDTTTSLQASTGYLVETLPSEDNNVDGIIDVRKARLGSGIPASYTIFTQRFTLANRIYDRIDEYTQDDKRAYVKLFTNEIFITSDNSHKVQIQNSLDVAMPGTKVRIEDSDDYPVQTSGERYVFGTDGPHRFGLYFATDSVELRGHYADGTEVLGAYGGVYFTTYASSPRGPSGVFVEANHVIFEGMNPGNNFDSTGAVDNNRVIEVIGNDFGMYKTLVNADQGGVHIREWDSTTYAAKRVRAYTIFLCAFDRNSLEISNGAGSHDTITQSRGIVLNQFLTSTHAPDAPIRFSGWKGPNPIDTSVVFPVGSAYLLYNQDYGESPYTCIVRGNDSGYVASDFQTMLSSVFTQNSAGERTATAFKSINPFEVSAFEDADGYPNTRAICKSIMQALADANAGDTISISQGPFSENPVLTDSTVVLLSNETSFESLNYPVFGGRGMGQHNFANWTGGLPATIGVDTNGSIQEALNAVRSPGLVRLQPGTHNVSSTITMQRKGDLSGPDITDGCDFAPTATISCSANTRMFDISDTRDVSIYNVELNIGTGASARFFRQTNAHNLNVEKVVFKRNGVRLYGMNNVGVQSDRDIPKFVNDGNDIGFGSGRVIYGDRAPMSTSSIVAGWKGDDANTVQVSSVLDYSGNNLHLTQATLTRKPTRAVIDSNYVITSSATKFVAASVNSTVHGGSERSVFVAFKTPASSTAAVVYKHGDQSNGVSIWTNTGNRAGMDLIIGGTSYSMMDTTTPNTWYIAQVYFNGNDATHRAGMTIAGVTNPQEYYWNSSQIAPTSLTVPTGGTNAVISLGARQGYTVRNGIVLNSNALGDAFTGSIGEVIVLNSASASDRNGVYCMLNSKWKAGSTSNELEKDDISVVTGNVSEPVLTNIYPSPADDIVNFDVIPATTESIRISIIDMMGSEVATIFNGVVDAGVVLPMNHDVTNLSSGAYMIVVTGDATHLSMPFLVQR